MRATVVPSLLLMLIAPTAMASPFCLAGPGLPPQCMYDDIATCLRAAREPDVSCVVNNETAINFLGQQRYCLIDNQWLAQCLFDDRNQCNNQAAKQNLLCIDRAEAAHDDSPYRYNKRLQR